MIRGSVSRRHFLSVAGSATGGLLLSNSLTLQEPTYPTIADSVRDFSAWQGYKGWHYGYTVDQYSIDGFRAMPHFVETAPGNASWFADRTDYQTRLSAQGGYPNGMNLAPAKSSQVHWPVRRWVSNVEDKIEINGILALLQPEESPDGITGYIYAEGQLLYFQTIDRNLPSSTFKIEFRVSLGKRIDFVVAPGATSTADAFLFTAKIDQGGCQNCCSVSPPATFRQGQLPWGPLLYDHKLLTDPDNTIADQGCALTCLSMALFYAGVPNTPGSLNTFMVNSNGYERVSHYVRFQDTVREIAKVSGKTIEWRDLVTTNPADLKAVLCVGRDPAPGVFQAGHPIIVGVRRVPPPPGKAWKPQHFVLVTEWIRDSLGIERFRIQDPATNSTSNLSDFHSFEGRGFVVDPPDPIAGLNMDVADASLMVTDSLGRRTGFDAALGAVIEIPNSVAYADALDGDISGRPAESFCSAVNINRSTNQRFNVSVNPVTDGVHNLSIRGYSDDGSTQPEVIVPINVPAGEIATLEVQYESAPGSVPQITMEKIVTIAVMRETINLQSAGVISVVILSTSAFDATDVDPLSVRFGPAEASEAHGKGHVEDVNRDGRPDLVLHFPVQESGITPGVTEVCLKGRTRSGRSIKGCTPI
jgi:hypothetical protein